MSFEIFTLHFVDLGYCNFLAYFDKGLDTGMTHWRKVFSQVKDSFLLLVWCKWILSYIWWGSVFFQTNFSFSCEMIQRKKNSTWEMGLGYVYTGIFFYFCVSFLFFNMQKKWKSAKILSNLWKFSHIKFRNSKTIFCLVSYLNFFLNFLKCFFFFSYSHYSCFKIMGMFILHKQPINLF